MRRSFSVTTSAATASLFAVFMLAACIEGPQGPAGPEGAEGPQGPAGVDGTIANQTCTECHDDDTNIKARQVQWEASKHLTGGNFERVESHGDYSCATCHTHEGFIERMATGEWATAELVENPTPINCRTCHLIHTTYTSADFALTTSAAFDLVIDGTTVDYGEGNLCAQCHQPRVPEPQPIMGGGDVTITSAYWGVHHGPQGGLLGGAGGYEFGGLSYPSSPHWHGDAGSNPDGCATCHMSTAYGAQAGGHTMKMAYDYHGSTVPNLAGCSACHNDTADWDGLGYIGADHVFDYKGVQTAIAADLATLKATLEAIGILTASDQAVPGTWTADQAGALQNYLMILEDGSFGVHNPDYIRVLLKNTISALP